MATKFLYLSAGIPRLKTPAAIYDQTFTTGAPVIAGTAITLPLSGTYNDGELEVYLNGQRLEVTVDYNSVGAGPVRTQITLVEDLATTDRLRFRTDRDIP